MKTLRKLFSEDSNCEKLCIRRVVGTIGFISCIVAIFHPEIDSSSITSLLGFSSALLGLTTVDKFATKKE